MSALGYAAIVAGLLALAMGGLAWTDDAESEARQLGRVVGGRVGCVRDHVHGERFFEPSRAMPPRRSRLSPDRDRVRVWSGTMNSDEIARIRQVCKEIADDMERDAKEFDGKPFNGRTVAEYFGLQGAAIAALAKIVETLAAAQGAEQ